MAITTLAITGRNWVQESGVTLSEGNWTLPITNILDPRPGIYAQTTDNTTTNNTHFVVDLGVARRIDLIWFVYLITGVPAQITIKIGNDPTFVTNLYTVSAASCWPIDHGGVTDNWGDSSTTGHYVNLTWQALNYPRFFRLPSTITARYALVSVDNVGEPAPLRIGCFGLSELTESMFRFNWSINFLDESSDVITKSGSTYTNLGRRKRRLSAAFVPLTATEMFGKFFDVLSWKGQSEPFVILPYADSTYSARWEKVGIYGKRSAAPSFSNPYPELFDLALQVDEL